MSYQLTPPDVLVLSVAGDVFDVPGPSDGVRDHEVPHEPCIASTDPTEFSISVTSAAIYYRILFRVCMQALNSLTNMEEEHCATYIFTHRSTTCKTAQFATTAAKSVITNKMLQSF
ncbi:hypothetical protein UY3_04646 [Chelonia mydas]|uniref:Uncharacterized protein n=1 Tax=Chelonia mydas TaxID=8469 RepID=M7BJQ8_CHEMY|nr:hypothetical protein UY3_04646 [Chelonia mydas]